MNAPVAKTKSLRRRLFGSHLAVIMVALGVLAIAFGAMELHDDSTPTESGRRGGGPGALVIGFGAAAIASGLVSWRVSRRLASPIEATSAATRSLAAGRYDVRLPQAGTAELDTLATAVNQLAHELDTTEQRRLRLIGDVAHELRNPLSTIEGTMEALLDGVISADEDTYARVGREAARLRRLADDLSSLSAAGELGVLNEEVIDLGDVAADVVAQLEPQAAAKDLTLTLQAGEMSPVNGDRDRLTQVLMNVIGNAVQYTSAGNVSVTVAESAGRIELQVTDSGRGLAQQDQTRIFERFHRVDTNFADGTGVGLAIAKLLVEAHAGSISADSPGLGQGTTITVVLPKAAGD